MIVAGAALSLSGRFAPQGTQAHRGLSLWAEDLNDAGGLVVRQRGDQAPIALIVYDDQSRAGPAIAATERLIVRDRVDLLVGPYASSLTLAVAPVADRHGKVLWNHGGSSDAIAERRFRCLVSVPSPASQYFAGVLAMIGTCAPDVRRLALLGSARGTFTQAVLGGAAAYARGHGLEVALRATYPQEPSAFAPLASRVGSGEPDVILGVGRTEDDLAFAQACRAGRLRARVIGLVATPIALFKQTLGGAADGFVGPSQWEPGVRYQPESGPTSEQFVARFRDRFAVAPDYPAAQAYAAGLIAQNCVAVAGTLEDEALRAAADALALTTFYGRFRLDAATGQQVGHELVVVQWQGARKRTVWPAEAAEARPQIPPPA